MRFFLENKETHPWKMNCEELLAQVKDKVRNAGNVVRMVRT